MYADNAQKFAQNRNQKTSNGETKDDTFEENFGMGITRILLLAIFFPIAASAQNEWVLQPWTQVIGGLGEALGLQVTCITPRPNLPYKATISKLGSVGFYTLESQADTLPKKLFHGERILTGDFNNDDHTDIVVYRKNQENSDYRVYLLGGIAVGVDTLNPIIFPDGLRLGCIADVNNDGKEDLILTNPSDQGGKGGVYFYFGPNITATADQTLIGDYRNSSFGQLCAVGDLNADGLSDLVVAGHGIIADSGPNGINYVYIYLGEQNVGINPANKILIKAEDESSIGLAIFDVNGDGIDDLLWISRDSIQRIYVHFGRTGSEDFKTTPDLKLSPPSFAGFGIGINSILIGADLNGDGYNDVVVGAGGFQNIYHYVLVYSGGPNMDGKFDAAVGTDNGSYFGQSIAAIGDVNGDGLADILVGAPQWGRFARNENKGFWGIFLGDRRIPTSSTPEPPIVPKEFKLNQNYPNPFNSSTVITYSMPFQSHITIRLFDLLGREVDKIRDSERAPGDYYFRYTPNGLPTGLYIYRLEAENGSGHSVRESKKLLLVR